MMKMKKEMKKKQRREILVGVCWDEEGYREEGWRGFNPLPTNPMTKQCPLNGQSGTVDSDTGRRECGKNPKVQNKGHTQGR